MLLRDRKNVEVKMCWNMIVSLGLVSRDEGYSVCAGGTSGRRSSIVQQYHHRHHHHHHQWFKVGESRDGASVLSLTGPLAGPSEVVSSGADSYRSEDLIMVPTLASLFSSKSHAHDIFCRGTNNNTPVVRPTTI